MDYISLSACQDGHLYAIVARNAALGIFCAAEKGFQISREKLGRNFLFTEYHWDTGAPHGTVKPLQDLGAVPVVEDLLQYLNQYPGRRTFERQATVLAFGDMGISEGRIPAKFLK